MIAMEWAEELKLMVFFKLKKQKYMLKKQVGPKWKVNGSCIHIGQIVHIEHGLVHQKNMMDQKELYKTLLMMLASQDIMLDGIFINFMSHLLLKLVVQIILLKMLE